MLQPVPSRIEPIFSPRIWGTRSLAPLFPAKVNLEEPIGEAWLTGNDCHIANGPFVGRSLRESWNAMPAEWRGTRFESCRDFPLLLKFLFPCDKLSVQVHPDDAYAAKYEQAAGGRGKTEMWHIVSAQPGAELFVGLKPGVTKETLLDSVRDRTVEKLLVHYAVHPGDTFFVPAGTQHAIGPGMVLCEVQEYSDLTYRVYDYGRVDPSGKPRELHVEKALEVTNFEDTGAAKVTPLALHSPDANKHLLIACEFFAVEHWDCRKTTPIESNAEEFQLFVILAGEGVIYDADSSFHCRPGEAWFFPASLPLVLLQPSQPTRLLRVVAPDPSALRNQLQKQGFEAQVLSRVVMS